jgi:type I restriction enzyme S subunit
MNEGRLLAHYEQIADAPDAIGRLRRFILDLAVRGKLVPQDPQDEPAAELLKRIAKEKARLVKAGEFREPSSFVNIERDALPFVPPSHWIWARLIDIASPSYGFAFASDKFNSQKRGMLLIRIWDISGMDAEAYYEGDFDPSYLVTAGDYLVGMDGDFNLRRWKGIDGLLNQRVMRTNGWRYGVNPEFIRLPLQFILDHLHGETSLTTVKHLSAKQVNGIEIPLPPLAEQHRIVAKVDELMALCDRLEAARTAREATRDRLAAASLARLNASDPETFQDEVRFALNALPVLTTRPDQIKQLRQTILNLTVRGKLVPQDPKD